MPKSSGSLKTNPNAFGGSFNYDARTGLGIGSLGGDPNSGIGQNWNMGDALSSPKGEFDTSDNEQELTYNISANTTVRDLAIFAGILSIEDDSESGIERKAHTSFQKTPTDSLAYKGTDISSLGGLGNSIAGVIGLSAGHDIKGNPILENFIKEVILFEYKGSSGQAAFSSANIANNLGGKSNKMYFIDRTSASTNTPDPGPDGASNDLGLNNISRSAINSKGIGQRRITVKIGKNKHYLHPTTDGGEAVYDSDLKYNAEEDETTYQNLERTSDKSYIDNDVVNKQINKKLKLTNIYSI